MHEIKTPLVASARSRIVGSVIVLALTALTAFVCWVAPKPKAEGLSGVVMDGLPGELGPLDSYPADVTEAERLILPKDTGFARKYYGTLWSTGPERIFCSIVLSGSERRSIHRPERCLPAQGWRIDNSHVESIPLASGRTLRVTALMLEKRFALTSGSFLTIHQYFLYWFVGNNVTTPSQTERILDTYWDMLVHRVNQRWAYVIVAKDISNDFESNGEDPQQTLAELKKFIHDSVPYFMKSEMPAQAATAAQ